MRIEKGLKNTKLELIQQKGADSSEPALRLQINR